MTVDESTADDGAIHDLWRHVDGERVEAVRAILTRLEVNRGRFTPDDRRDAFDLAHDRDWPVLAELPVVVAALLS
jgi:hypothetical protein